MFNHAKKTKGFAPTRVCIVIIKNFLRGRNRKFFKRLCLLLLAATIVSRTFNLRDIERNTAFVIDHPTPTDSVTRGKCALLFFGLVKDSFQSISLPSINRHIVETNNQCEIFLHTYNITDVPLNPRNLEHTSHKANVSQAYLLTNKVALEDMDNFNVKREKVLERTRKFYHRGWGKCCVSHDNMIKQWHSIEGVWNLMQKYENENGIHFHQIGLFRSDVYYTRAVDIFDSKGAIPNFAHHHGYNDRLFYGSYENAKIWASQRFDFVDIFEKKYMSLYNSSGTKAFKNKKDGYHSETYVKNLMDDHGIDVEMKDHCLWRVRSGKKIMVDDCDGMTGFSTFSEVKSYRPPVYDPRNPWTMALK